MQQNQKISRDALIDAITSDYDITRAAAAEAVDMAVPPSDPIMASLDDPFFDPATISDGPKSWFDEEDVTEILLQIEASLELAEDEARDAVNGQAAAARAWAYQAAIADVPLAEIARLSGLCADDLAAVDARARRWWDMHGGKSFAANYRTPERQEKVKARMRAAAADSVSVALGCGVSISTAASLTRRPVAEVRAIAQTDSCQQWFEHRWFYGN